MEKIFRIKWATGSTGSLDPLLIKLALEEWNKKFEVEELPAKELDLQTFLIGELYQEELDWVREALRNIAITPYKPKPKKEIIDIFQQRNRVESETLGRCAVCKGKWRNHPPEHHNQVDHKGRKMDCPVKLSEEVKENG